MRVLLTGSSGWLGRFLAPRLRAAGHAAIGLDIVPGAETHVVGSVSERAVVERAFANRLLTDVPRDHQRSRRGEDETVVTRRDRRLQQV
jgi:UDP-glucose 4-epimerase